MAVIVRTVQAVIALCLPLLLALYLGLLFRAFSMAAF